MSDESVIDLGTVQTSALLTGAGFSANWGAPVADQVWSKIFGNERVQACPRVRKALLAEDGFDFESVLHRAQDGEFGHDAEPVLSAAIQRVFDDINALFVPLRSPIDLLSFGSFLSNFVPRSSGETSFIFTLNQDVFLERLFGFGDSRSVVQRPSVPSKPIMAGSIGFDVGPQLNETGEERVFVPELAEMPTTGWQQLAGGNWYVKLHGSWDWIPSKGHQHMVLGGGKTSAIKRSPLLKFYFEVFRSFLFSGDKTLTIVGYGFRDSHVNAIIAEAAANSGLKVEIWDPRLPSEMRRHLLDTESGCVIWQALSDYHQTTLRDYFGPEPEDEQGGRRLLRESMLVQSFMRPKETWDWPKTG